MSGYGNRYSRNCYGTTMKQRMVGVVTRLILCQKLCWFTHIAPSQKNEMA